MRSANGATLTGRLVALDRDSLVLRPDGDPTGTITVPGEALAIEVSAGRQRRWARGMGVGLITGAVGGAIIGAATFEPCIGWCILTPNSREGWAALNATLMGLGGVVAGGVVGALIETERWRPVTVGSDSVRVGLRSTVRSIGVQLRFD